MASDEHRISARSVLQCSRDRGHLDPLPDVRSQGLRARIADLCSRAGRRPDRGKSRKLAHPNRLPKLNRGQEPESFRNLFLKQNEPRRVLQRALRPQLLQRRAASPTPAAGNVISNSQMRDFSVGACYARTEKNPNGAYFVTMMFY